MAQVQRVLTDGNPFVLPLTLRMLATFDAVGCAMCP